MRLGLSEWLVGRKARVAEFAGTESIDEERIERGKC
jgi:hypothetical protein